MASYLLQGDYEKVGMICWLGGGNHEINDAMPEHFPKSEMTILVAFETDTASYPWGYEFDGVRQSLIFPEQTRGQVQVLHLEKNCAVEYRTLAAEDLAVFSGCGLFDGVGR